MTPPDLRYSKIIPLIPLKYIVGLLLLVACQPKHAEETLTTQAAELSFQLPDSSYAILSYQPDWTWLFTKAKPAPLSPAELFRAEQIIQRALEETYQQARTNWKNHPLPGAETKPTRLSTQGYKRQYLAVITASGEKVVWVNFFCNSFGSNSWQTSPLLVLDGGDCYFQLKVNLSTGTYHDLLLNGYA